jgi:lipopolysaccharide export system protein LptA
VWTPKRILLLVLGFLVFSFLYGIYAHFLGGVDGLPPLPADGLPIVGDIDPPLPPQHDTELMRKLKMAFGEDCAELKRKIRLEMRARGIALAADNFSIEPDGRVKLWPFSIALFGKDHVEGQFPEINTVQSDIAYLRFDKPVNNIGEMASRKIVGGELVGDRGRRQGPNAGGVTIRNNRRTPSPDDDLTLTTPGPVYYEESRELIWTADFVRIVDEQNKDGKNPTIIEATGMNVYLQSEGDKAKEEKPAAATSGGKAARKDRAPGNVSGVKALALRSEVDMRLYVDSNSGFLAAPGKGPKDKVVGQVRSGDQALGDVVKNDSRPAGKDLVHIKTQGPFYYDVLTDRARFDVSEHPGPRPNSVEVIRRTGTLQGACDQLDCEHLILQFQKRQAGNDGAGPAAASPFREDRSSQLEIDSAHAWGGDPEESKYAAHRNTVTLTSDAEVLSAWGSDLIYDARKRLTILKGNPEMTALKDGNEIRAPQLEIEGAGDKDHQQTRITGPGTIDWLDSATKERTQRARFKDKLVSSKDGAFDVITLTGDAAFEELEPGQQLQPGQAPKLKQRLQAQGPKGRITVWLSPAPANDNNAPGNSENHRRPHHLEAVGQVSTQSPEMIVRDAERFVIWFREAAAGSDPPADSVAGPSTGSAPGSPKATTGGPAPAAPASESEKPKRPIDLRARSVEVYVIQTGNHNELDKLWCEGNVHVHQAGESKDDKGVDITGQTLQLVKFLEGHVLTVTGTQAEVQLDKLIIIGPVVNIDQKENKAWVDGMGLMRMPSNAKLGGMDNAPAAGRPKPPPTNEPPSELTVHWNRDMFFDGQRAVYHGGVQAEQDNSRLICQEMQVFLDRFVSLKDGGKSGPPAKVENLVCDKSVRIEDTEWTKPPDPKKLVRYQRIDSRELSYNNEEGVMVAPGPGVLRILQWGVKGEAVGSSPTPTPAPARQPNGKPPEEELKLTRVQYLTRMFANNTTRTAIFYDGVELVHLPSNDPDVAIDLDKLPEGALYLRCDQLKVYSRQEPNAKGMQQMEARGHAMVQSREFSGRADIVKYDESKELVVLEANEGNLATLVRQKAKGAPQEEVKGKKIYYWRRTNDFKIEGGTGAKVIQ